MKHIVRHPETSRLLWQWAASESNDSSSLPLHIIRVYFWYLGSPLEKSEEGLLRSFLIQPLQASRDLDTIACPKRWEAVKKAVETSEPWELDLFFGQAIEPWTNTELL